MPALSYSKHNIEKNRFEYKILNGIKIHTIRKMRKKIIKVGDTLYHYKNWRTPQIKKICENICHYAKNIIIIITKTKFPYITIFIDGISINPLQIYLLAKNDGFNNLSDFIDFFDQGSPFSGQIIGWKEGINYEI